MKNSEKDNPLLENHCYTWQSPWIHPLVCKVCRWAYITLCGSWERLKNSKGTDTVAGGSMSFAWLWQWVFLCVLKASFKIWSWNLYSYIQLILDALSLNSGCGSASSFISLDATSSLEFYIFSYCRGCCDSLSSCSILLSRWIYKDHSSICC